MALRRRRERRVEWGLVVVMVTTIPGVLGCPGVPPAGPSPDGGGEAPDSTVDVTAPDVPGDAANAALSICEGEGRWCWVNPLPQGRGLTAVWRASPDDLWAAIEGPGGGTSPLAFLRRHTDGAWTRVETRLDARVSAMWGAGPASIWAAGSDAQLGAATILHWNGAAWVEVQVLRPANPLDDIQGSGRDDVWAAGPGIVLHFDGQAWTTVDVAAMTSMFPPFGLARIAVEAPGEVWISMGTRLMRLHAGSWTFEDAPLDVTALWAAGPNDVFRALSSESSSPVEIERWDGATWTPMATIAQPPESFGSVSAYRIERIAGGGPADVWAVDTAGASYHFDGVAWRREDSGPLFSVTDLWAGPSGTGFSVGRAGELRALAPSASGRITRGAKPTILALAGSGPGDVWAGGVRGTDPLFSDPPASLLHFDGREVSVVEPPAAIDSTNRVVIRALWAPNPGTVWVGGNAGLLARGPGDGWESFVVTDQDVADIWGAARDDAWMATVAGSVFHYDGYEWSPVAVPGLTNAQDIHGSASNDVWIVGNTVVHWDGRAWTVAADDEGPDMPGGASEVWANAPNDVWITAQAPMSTELRHFDGAAWRTVRSFFREVLWDLWSPGPDELYVGGGTVRHYRSGTWTDTGGPGATSLWGVAGVELWGASGLGALVRKTLP